MKYYRTPASFYSTETLNGVKYVLDAAGETHVVKASGFYIFLPSIDDGIGTIRQRYPIAPIHEEGSAIWKQLEALRQIVLDPFSHGHMMQQPIRAETILGDDPTSHHYTTSKANVVYGEHQHELTLTAHQYNDLAYGGRNVTVTTQEAAGHMHTLELYAVDHIW